MHAFKWLHMDTVVLCSKHINIQSREIRLKLRLKRTYHGFSYRALACMCFHNRILQISLLDETAFVCVEVSDRSVN